MWPSWGGVRAPCGAASRTAHRIKYDPDEMGKLPINLGVARKMG